MPQVSEKLLIKKKNPSYNIYKYYMLFKFHNFLSDDIFTIDELAVFEGNHNDQTYAVAGDILDGVFSLSPLF